MSTYTKKIEKTLKNPDLNQYHFLRKNCYTFKDAFLHFIEEKDIKYKNINNLYTIINKKYEQETGSTLPRSTFNDWMNDKNPSYTYNRRNVMYRICFSLKLNIDEVERFFNHVYFNKPFNFKDVKELIYYYCFLNNKSYKDALKLYNCIDNFNEKELTHRIQTSSIKEDIQSFANDNELISYVYQNKHNFIQYNTEALSRINTYLQHLKGNKYDKEIYSLIKRNKRISDKDLRQCSLLIRDYLQKYNDSLDDGDDNDFAADHKKYKDCTSIDFMLYLMLDTSFREVKHNTEIDNATRLITQNDNLPSLLRMNFPSRSTFSTLLKDNSNKSNDLIRKALILLHFYYFMLSNNYSENKNDYIYDEWVDNVDQMLEECCFNMLDVTNSYDWLFMYSVSNGNPIDTFKDILRTLYNKNIQMTK